MRRGEHAKMFTRFLYKSLTIYVNVNIQDTGIHTVSANRTKKYYHLQFTFSLFKYNMISCLVNIKACSTRAHHHHHHHTVVRQPNWITKFLDDYSPTLPSVMVYILCLKSWREFGSCKNVKCVLCCCHWFH